jgi:hypothetical protein
MEHPLIPNLSELTLDELITKITELNKKLTIAMRSGNGHLCGQIRMAIDSYQSAYREKIDQQNKSAGRDFGNIIDIS